jgi:hypothetical protein
MGLVLSTLRQMAVSGSPSCILCTDSTELGRAFSYVYIYIQWCIYVYVYVYAVRRVSRDHSLCFHRSLLSHSIPVIMAVFLQ